MHPKIFIGRMSYRAAKTPFSRFVTIYQAEKVFFDTLDLTYMLKTSQSIEIAEHQIRKIA